MKSIYMKKAMRAGDLNAYMFYSNTRWRRVMLEHFDGFDDY